jgi:hypothetical protein
LNISLLNDYWFTGCSGIYKSNDYLKGFHEDGMNLNPGTVRSAYHTRQSQVTLCVRVAFAFSISWFCAGLSWQYT